jgi:hypothetical protein
LIFWGTFPEDEEGGRGIKNRSYDCVSDSRRSLDFRQGAWLVGVRGAGLSRHSAQDSSSLSRHVSVLLLSEFPTKIAAAVSHPHEGKVAASDFVKRTTSRVTTDEFVKIVAQNVALPFFVKINIPITTRYNRYIGKKSSS